MKFKRTGKGGGKPFFESKGEKRGLRISKGYATTSSFIVKKHVRAASYSVVYAGSTGDAPRERRLREGAEIVLQVKDWAGGVEQAGTWYRSQPISALGGRTAEALVMSGKAALVREYLDHLSQGGHA